MSKDKIPPKLREFLGKAKNRVTMIGIELEGGWMKVPDNARVIRDGSVVFDPYVVPGGNLPRIIGELPSLPMPVEKFPEWVTKFYPSHVNESCGMHVHMSFANAFLYDRVMDEGYQAAVIEFVT